MFEELPFILGFLIVGLIISYVLIKYTPSPFNKIVNILAIFGIIFHELCHIIMCLITNTKIEGAKLIERIKLDESREKYAYRGYVKLHDEAEISFLQAVAVCLAPLFFSFWLFFYLFEQIFYTDLNAGLFFLYLGMMISLLLGAAPSLADLGYIPRAFRINPSYSMYQILLLIASILTALLLVDLYKIFIFHEIIAYSLILILYYSFKYSILAVKSIIIFVLRKKHIISEGINYKEYTRRRYKPIKPKKLRIEEPHW